MTTTALAVHEPPGEQNAWLRGATLVAAMLSLGMALQANEGYFVAKAVYLLMTAIGLTIAAVGLRTRSPGWQILCTCSFAVALAVQFYCLTTTYPGSLAITPPGSLRHSLFKYPRGETNFLTPTPFHWGLILAGCSAFLLFSKRAAVVHTGFVIALAAHLALGLFFVDLTHPPYSDVFLVQQEGVKAFLAGENPYAITIPNLFNLKAPEFPIDEHGRVAFGYAYPPLTLFLVIPAYLLAGDCRFANAIALTLAGALLGYMRPGRYSKLAAMMFLFTPRIFMILEIGTTEPFVILTFVATVFAAIRRRWETPFLYGLCLASKQYTVFLAPLGILLLAPPVSWKRYLGFMTIAFTTVALLTLPFLAAYWPDSWRSMIELQLRYHPLNEWVLSIPAWGLWHFPRWMVEKLLPLSFACAIGVTGFAMVRAPRSPANFCLAAAMAYLLFVAFNKQAYAHYYLLVLSMLASTLASGFPEQITGRDVPDSPDPAPAT